LHQLNATDIGRIRYQQVCDECGAVVEYSDTTQAPTRRDDTDDISDLLAKLEASVRRRREQSAVPKAASWKKVAAKQVAAKKPPSKK